MITSNTAGYSVTSNDPRDFLLHSIEALLDFEPVSEDIQERFGEKIQDAFLVVCEALGCRVVKDHCGKPEHDYCVYCKQIRPGQAK